MDMGPYIASIPRLFNLKKLLKKRVKILKNKDKLIMSIKFLLNFEAGDYYGTFKFGGKYKNEIKITNKIKKILIQRVFSPPDDTNLILKSKFKKRYKKIRFKKDNCFRNFFAEVLKNIKYKRYYFYYNRMKHDAVFRANLTNKII